MKKYFMRYKTLILKNVIAILLIVVIGVNFVDIYYHLKVLRLYNDKLFYYKKTSEDNSGEIKEYKTIIDHQKQYSNQKIVDINGAIELIERDSLSQEKKCQDKKIKKYDEKIKKNSGIYAINLCEIDLNTAEKISNLIEKIYQQYPFLKQYLTNLTIVNDGGKSSYIAAFKPSYTFATSKTVNKFPFVIKMQIFLNASYYLDNNYVDNIINNAVVTGYFPKNADKYSIVYHEFVHLIMYILTIRENNGINPLFLRDNYFFNYVENLEEYSNEKIAKEIVYESMKELNVDDENILASNISGYAANCDEYGKILYNEVIAEALHDVYVNGTNAAKESISIQNVVDRRILKDGIG